jgi:hypothetical protein
MNVLDNALLLKIDFILHSFFDIFWLFSDLVIPNTCNPYQNFKSLVKNSFNLEKIGIFDVFKVFAKIQIDRPFFFEGVSFKQREKLFFTINFFFIIGKVENKPFNKRKRNIEKVVEEIEILSKKFGVYNLRIMDELFTYDLERVHKFCDLLKQKNLKLNILKIFNKW